MLIDRFLEDEKVNGIGEKTLSQHRSVLGVINAYKSLDKKWTKQDVNNYILSLEYEKSTIEKHKQLLKKFFSWSDNKKAIEHLKIKSIGNNLRREDILTVEDINKLIEITPYPVYKALIAFLFESGARISEALAVKVSDISETDKGMIISVPSTKTGNGATEYRRDIYPFSAGYIKNHIINKKLGKDALLFDICHVAIHNYLQRLRKKSGITKPISCHKFRNARATDMILRGYNESIIRKKLGWTGDSAMIARYTKTADDDVINSHAEIQGTDNKPNLPIANIKQAEGFKTAEAALELSAMKAENQELRSEMESLKEWVVKMMTEGAPVASTPTSLKLPESYLKTEKEILDKMKKGT